MNELQKVFDYQGTQVRTVVKEGEPWFVAKDVCEVLKITWNGAKTLERIKDQHKGVVNFTTPGGEQAILCIGEPGLYKLIARSNKEEAEKFSDWVYEDVLPSIRKHGTYMTPDTLEQMVTSPEFGIKLLTALKAEQEQRQALQAKIDEQKPMVMFAESCIASNDCLLVREVAKLASKNGILIGEKNLWSKLREWGEVNRKNEPYQHAMNAGRWQVRQGTYSTPYGAETYRTFKVSPKGQVYIIEKLRSTVEVKEIAN